MGARYLVWFDDCESEVRFDDRKSAEHYAKLNAGNITDLETNEVIFRSVEAEG